ncbi:MAG: hydrogenase maturation protease [Euryarchaeota archaeon]|nr:hydrogenase maturation protease [Euryarchaeota archaeon]
MKKVAIIGVGNSIMRDDGVGIHTVQELQKIKLPGNVEVQDADTNAFAVLECMDGKDKAIIIDAYRGGREPGTIYKFKFTPDSSNIKLSLHDIDFTDALKSGRHAYRLPPDIVIIGVEPEVIEFGLELSPRVQKAIPNVIEEVLKEV